MFQVTRQVVCNWIGSGRLSVVKFGKKYYISEESLTRFANARPAVVRPEWAEEAVNCMHQYGIRIKQLAEETGYSSNYVSHILSGGMASKRAKPVILATLERLIAKKEEVTL